MAGNNDSKNQGRSQNQNQTGYQGNDWNRKGGESSQNSQNDDQNRSGRIGNIGGVDQDLEDDSDMGQV